MALSCFVLAGPFSPCSRMVSSQLATCCAERLSEPRLLNALRLSCSTLRLEILSRAAWNPGDLLGVALGVVPAAAG